MGTTPNLNLPYPEDSDTPNVPRDIKALAAALDTTVGKDVGNTFWATSGAHTITRSGGYGYVTFNNGSTGWSAAGITVPISGLYLVSLYAHIDYNHSDSTFNGYVKIEPNPGSGVFAYRPNTHSWVITSGMSPVHLDAGDLLRGRVTPMHRDGQKVRIGGSGATLYAVLIGSHSNIKPASEVLPSS